MNKSPYIRCQGEDFGRTYVFKEEIAKKYGVESAILIQHFQYSINYHKRNGTHFHEERYWTYDSITNLTNLYPYWSSDTIRRIIKRLVDKDVIIIGNFNKHKYDRTRWFAFQEEDKFIPVDKYENPVENPVDNLGIEKDTQHGKESEKKSTNEPFLSKNRPETRRNGHVAKPPNGCGEIPKPIPVSPSVYISSVEEGFIGKRNDVGKNTLRSFSYISSRFAVNITKGYIPPSSLRKKLHELGHSDNDIDMEILKMVRYHEKNPQIIRNEHSCILGWFKKSRKSKNS